MWTVGSPPWLARAILSLEGGADQGWLDDAVRAQREMEPVAQDRVRAGGGGPFRQSGDARRYTHTRQIIPKDGRSEMRIGLDSYAYHRLLGEIRPGEEDSGERMTRGSLDVVAEANRLNVSFVSLETCFLPLPSKIDPARYIYEAGSVELGLSWGHPNGLEYGRNDAALAELFEWLRVAPDLGCKHVRVVAASPHVKRDCEALSRTARSLAEACIRARDADVELAIENHADLTAAEIDALLDQVDGLGVCLDTVNAIRVGDEPLEATRLLVHRTHVVHLKDVDDPADDSISGPTAAPLGEGVVPVVAILEALNAAGFQGPLCIELGHLGPGVRERTFVEQSLSWLRSALAEI